MRVTKGFIDAAIFLKEQRIFSYRDLPYSTQMIPLATILAILRNTLKTALLRKEYLNGIGVVYLKIWWGQ